MRKGKFDPISDDIRDHLHWLPIPQRVQFKLGLLVYKCLHGGAPPYLVVHHPSWWCTTQSCRASLSAEDTRRSCIPCGSGSSMKQPTVTRHIIFIVGVIQTQPEDWAVPEIVRSSLISANAPRHVFGLFYVPSKSTLIYVTLIIFVIIIIIIIVEILIQNSDVPALRSLRSTARGCLVVPRTKTVTIGPRSFATTGPTFWNSLPTHLRDDSNSLSCFKSSLKAYLFKQAYPNWYRFYMAQFVWTIWTVLDNLFHACMFLHEHKHHRDGLCCKVALYKCTLHYITLHYITVWVVN